MLGICIKILQRDKKKKKVDRPIKETKMAKYR